MWKKDVIQSLKMKENPPPTLGEIAARAGFDQSTVSLALRNDPRLKLTTRQKIQNVAAEMGYRPNPTMAQLMSLLRAGRKHHFQSTIAVLNFGPPSVSTVKILSGAEQRAKTLGYGFEVFYSKDFEAQRLEKVLISRGIRGVLVVCQMGGNQLPEDYRSVWEKFSSCVVGIRPVNPSLHFVADDNYLTSLTAIRQLYTLGFRRLGLAMHRGINFETEHRFTGGYLAACSSLSDVCALPILYLDPNQPGMPAVRSWYRKQKPEVIVCIQPELLEWLKAAEIKVPEDVGLVSLDVEPAGHGWAGMLQNRFDLGHIAIDTVVSQINHNETGVPQSQRAVLSESVWVAGTTLQVRPARE